MEVFAENFEKTGDPFDRLSLNLFRDTIAGASEARLLSTTQLNNVIDKGLKKLGVEKKRSNGRNWVYGIKEINSFPHDPFAGDFCD